jgi:hypothetical protein
MGQGKQSLWRRAYGTFAKTKCGFGCMIQSVSIQISKSMDPESKLDDLLALHESEIVEFKKAESNFHFND